MQNNQWTPGIASDTGTTSSKGLMACIDLQILAEHCQILSWLVLTTRVTNEDDNSFGFIRRDYYERKGLRIEWPQQMLTEPYAVV